MDKKITLDIDFGDNDIKEINIPKEEIKTENKDKKYVKELIKKGLDICDEQFDCVNKLIDNSDLFEECGINQIILDTLCYLSQVYGYIVPNILIANYDELQENAAFSTEEEKNQFFKEKRKLLLKRIQKLDEEE